jgi:hypothetical protein
MRGGRLTVTEGDLYSGHVIKQQHDMRRLLILLSMFVSLCTSAQINPDTVLLGEYANYFIEKGNVYTHDAGILVQFPLPEKIKRGSAGHPWALLIGESGQCYFALGDSRTWKKASIVDGETSSSYFNFHVIVRKAGGVIAINDKLETAELRTTGRTVQAAAGHYLLLRNSGGEVYQYSWSSAPKVIRSVTELKILSYSKVNLPGNATDITTSRSMFSASVVNGFAYVWCDSYGAQFLGLTKSSGPVIIPIPEPTIRVAASDNTLHFLTVNSKLYGMGNNWVGEVGNGQINPLVLAGNTDMKNTLFVKTPVLIDTGVLWVSKNPYYGFRNFLKTIRGVLKAWGYPKFGLTLIGGFKPVDDHKNIGDAAVTKPWGIFVPDKMTTISSAQVKAMRAAGTYPPAEVKPPRILIEIRYVYDDGSIEVVKEN